MSSFLLVAPIRIIPFCFPSTPSNLLSKTESNLLVASCKLLSLEVAKASISSKNIIAVFNSNAKSNTCAKFLALSPYHLLIMLSIGTYTIGILVSLAIYFANAVFPTPGGPSNNTPLGSMLSYLILV